MSSSFSRSIVTQQTSTSGRSIGILLIVIVFLGAWFAWLLLGQIPVFLVTDTAEILDANHVVALFPPDALLQIESGQEASIRLNDFPIDEYGSIAATVEQVVEQFQDGRTKVELQLTDSTASIIPIQAGLTGQVEIKVDQESPLTLLLRTTGQRLSTSINSSGANPK